MQNHKPSSQGEDVEAVYLGEGIETIAEIVGKLTLPLENVKKLNLHGNQVSGLAGLELFVQVKELYLASNEIQHLNFGNFSTLQNLCVLDLASNNLTHISNSRDDILPLPSLQELNLSYNQIVDISGVRELPKLRKLDLRDNLLRSPEQLLQLGTCESLVSLKLQDENLEKRMSKSSGSGFIPSNPICSVTSYPIIVLDILQSLEELDGVSAHLLRTLPQNIQSSPSIAAEEVPKQGGHDPLDIDSSITPRFDSVVRQFMSRKHVASERQLSPVLDPAADSAETDDFGSESDSSGGVSTHSIQETSSEQLEYVANRAPQHPDNPWKVGPIRPKRSTRRVEMPPRLHLVGHSVKPGTRNRANKRKGPSISQQKTCTSGTGKPMQDISSDSNIAEKLDSQIGFKESSVLTDCNTDIVHKKSASNSNSHHLTAMVSTTAAGTCDSLNAPWEPKGLATCFMLLGGQTKEHTIQGSESCEHLLQLITSKPVQVPDKLSWDEFLEIADDREPIKCKADNSSQTYLDVSSLESRVEALQQQLKERDAEQTSLRHANVQLEQQLALGVQDCENKANLQIDSLQRKLDRTESDRNEIIDENTRLHSRVKRLEAENRQFADEKHSLEDKCARLKNKLEVCNKRIRSLTKSIRKSEERNETANLELADHAIMIAHEKYSIENENTILQQQLENARAQVLAAETKTSEQQKKLEALQAELEEATNTLKRFEEELASASDTRTSIEVESSTRIRALEVQLKSTTEELDLYKKKLSSACKKLEAKKRSLAEVEHGKSELVQLVKQQQTRLEQISKANKQLRFKASTVSLQKTAVANAQDALASTQSQLAAKEDELNKLQSEFDDLKVTQLKLQSEFESEVADLKQQIASTEVECKLKTDAAESAVKVKNAMLDDQSNTLIDLRKTVESLKDQCAVDSRRSKELERRVNELQGTRDELESDLENQEANVKDLEEIIAAMREHEVTSEKYQAEMNQKDKIIAAVEEEVASLREDFQKRNREFESTRIDLEKSKHMCNTLTTAVEGLQNEADMLQDKVQELQSEITSKTELLARSEASMSRIKALVSDTKLEKSNLSKQVEELKTQLKISKARAQEQESDIQVLARSLEIERQRRAKSVKKFEALFKELKG